MKTTEEFNTDSQGLLPGHLGITITDVTDGQLQAEMPVTQFLMAPNGYLHAGSVVSLADSCAGCGCLASLPTGSTGFTTIELKSNHLGTARDGVLDGVANIVHRGRTTQVWDVVITHRETAKTIALFRCTQMIIYPRPEVT